MNADAGWLLATAAETFVGTPFRLHGRDPNLGLDCIGLLLRALESIGRKTAEPQPYGLRNLSIASQLKAATLLDLEEAYGAERAGDVILFRLAAAQWHAGIVSCQLGLIHAHAGLRRVVNTPTLPDWPIERHWRVTPS